MHTVLIDLVVLDRSQNGHLLIPYLQGLLKEKGLTTATYRFGLRAYAALEPDMTIKLGREDLNAFSHLLLRERPANLVFSHRPSSRVIDFLDRMAADTKICWLSSLAEDEVPCLRRVGEACFVDCGSLLNSIPDFHYRPANEDARLCRPFPCLVLGNECNYRRRVDRNPLLKNLDLPPGTRRNGCTFCVTRIRRDEDILPCNGVRLRSLLTAALKTPRWGNHRKRVKVVGEGSFFRIDEIARVAKNLGITNTDFIFDARVDHLLKNSSAIEAACRLFSGTGNKVQIGMVGVENFSNAELNRFNKGFHTGHILRMILLLRCLKESHPGVFEYEEYGGFSLILFTPWTTLADVKFNLHMIRALGVEHLCSMALKARLRLYPSQPLYHLAKKDGLLKNYYREKAFDSSFNNFYPKETPWKFVDKKVEHFNRLALRIGGVEPASNPHESTVGPDIQRLAEDGGEREKLTRAIVLLHKLELSGKAGIRSLSRFTSHSKGTTPLQLRQRGPLGYWEEEKELFKKGQRKAGMVDNIMMDDAECAKITTALSAQFRHVKVVKEPSGRYDIYYSDDPAMAEELADICRKTNSAAGPANALRIGELLGYPRCCIEDFTRNSYHLVTHHAVLWLLKRYEAPGEVSPFMNPFLNGTAFIPCSLTCKETLKRLLARQSVRQNDRSGCLEDYLKLPVIHLLPFFSDQVHAWASRDLPTTINSVVIRPSGKVGKSFTYKPIHHTGIDQRISFLLEGDRLTFDGGRLSVYRGRSLLHTYCTDAVIWYYKRALDSAFWLPFLENIVLGMKGSDTIRHANEKFQTSYEGLLATVRLSLEEASRRLGILGFEHVRSILEKNTVIAEFRDRESRGRIVVRIILQLAADAQHAWARGRKVAVCFAPGTEVVSPRTEGLVAAVFEAVEHGVKVE